MRTQKEIEKELKKYDAIETFPYEQNGHPYDDMIRQWDTGYRSALRWVLEQEENA